LQTGWLYPYTKRLMNSLFHKHSPLRIFAFSALATIAILVSVLFGLGASALLITFILAAIEITFSFDNAIINAKVLGKLSPLWQTLFLTVGIVIAIFGMRVLFPVLIVSITAHLGWHNVVDLALHHPKEYAHHLEQAHASIAAFGGAFLLLLSLNFFMDDEKDVHWIGRIERQLKRFSHWAVAPAIMVVVVVILAKLPDNTHAGATLGAGLLGGATFVLIQVIDGLVERWQGAAQKGKSLDKQTGMVALSSLLYLEILDASFSFDGVIGAFAITNDVLLIAAGLGIGALWVRSLTVYMVRRETLGNYRFIEHGAHYTVLALALVLLTSVLWEISDFIPGLAGLAIIGASIVSSVQYRKSKQRA